MRWLARALGLVLATLAACSSFTTADSPPVADAGPDALDVEDGGPFSWPLTTTDDFERTTAPVDGPLHLVLRGTQGSVDLSDCTGASSPQVCSPPTSATFDVGNASDESARFLADANLDSTRRKLRLDFGMTISAKPSAQAQFAGIHLTTANLFIEVNAGIYRVGDQFQNVDGSYDNDSTELGAIDGDWSYYQIYVDLDAARITLRRDGQLVGQHVLRAKAAAGSFDAVSFGISYTGKGSDGLHETFDNVGIGQY